MYVLACENILNEKLYIFKLIVLLARAVVWRALVAEVCHGDQKKSLQKLFRRKEIGFCRLASVSEFYSQDSASL